MERKHSWGSGCQGGKGVGCQGRCAGWQVEQPYLRVSVSISGLRSPTKMWWCWEVSCLGAPPGEVAQFTWWRVEATLPPTTLHPPCLTPCILWTTHLHLLAQAEPLVHGGEGGGGGVVVLELHEAVRVVAWGGARCRVVQGAGWCMVQDDAWCKMMHGPNGSWCRMVQRCTWFPNDFASLDWSDLIEQSHDKLIGHLRHMSQFVRYFGV